MNNIPNDGKVVIIDDIYQEILPLIKILNKNCVPVLYYSGKMDELPINALEGTRLVFLDLRFSTNTDGKTIASNACGILNKVIGKQNGPYLLIIWSTTYKDYKEILEENLSNKDFKPEFILYLSKSNYFREIKSHAYSLIDDIDKILSEEDIDYAPDILKKISFKIITEEDEKELEFIDNNLEKLEEDLYEGLKQAGLLSLFILWENTVRNSVHKVINEIYAQIPDGISADKKLPAMVYYLAKNRLEKQFANVNDNEKLSASLYELNELFTYFYSEDVSKISLESFNSIDIQENSELVPSDAKFNSWKIIMPAHNYEAPGNIYNDNNKLFEFYHLLKNYDDDNNEKYQEQNKKLNEDNELTYVFININGECETAQNKYPVVRIIPGVIIPCNKFNKYKDDGIFVKTLKNTNAYLYKELDTFEYQDKECYLLFNINQCTFVNKNIIDHKDVLFALHRKYYLALRQYISSDFSKQGINLYK